MKSSSLAIVHDHSFSHSAHVLQNVLPSSTSNSMRTGLPAHPFIFSRSYCTLPPGRICNCDSFDYGQSAFPSLSCTPFFPLGEEGRKQKDVEARSVEISTSTHPPSIPDLCLHFHHSFSPQPRDANQTRRLKTTSCLASVAQCLSIKVWTRRSQYNS